MTANITDVDHNGLVTIMFSSNIENYMFNITKKQGYNDNRLLKENSTTSNLKKNSMNISDINSTYLEMYVIPSEDRHLNTPNFPLYKLNFTWEIVYFRYNFMKIQLYFNDSSFVSTDPIWDTFTLIVQPNHTDLFYSKDLNSDLDPNYY